MILTAFLVCFASAPQVEQQAYVKASNPDANDSFGEGVAVWGDTLVVGAPGEASASTGVNGDGSDDSAPFAGAVYVFRRSGTNWTQEAYLKASNAEAGDVFGTSVALRGNTLVVGARSEDSSVSGVDGNQADNGKSGAGAAYVFVRNDTTWSQQAYLKASNPDAFDGFGSSVGVSQDLLVVGAPQEGSPAQGIDGDQGNAVNGQLSGAAYVFVRNGTTWSQEAYLKASNSNTTFEFATSVAISGETIVVGTPYEPVGGPSPESQPDVGAAYVFVRNGTTWSQEAYLKASNDGWDDVFGTSVGIDGDSIVVGAPGESSSSTGVNGADNDFATFAGAAYVFARTGTVWTEQAYLKPSNTGSFDRFGSAVSIAGDEVVVAARNEESAEAGIDGDPLDDSAPGAGAVYRFDRTGSTWSPGEYIKASNTEAGDEFSVVAVRGDKLAVGAPGEDGGVPGIDGDQGDNGASSAGAVYVFDLGAEPDVYCTPKASSLGCQATIAASDPNAQPVSGAGDYSVVATRIQGLKAGLVFAGVAGPAVIPFNGGTLCLAPPLKRGPVLFSGGSATGCDGSYATLVNDGQIVPAGLDAGAGNTGWYQYWYRDPGDPVFGVALSNALELAFD